MAVNMSKKKKKKTDRQILFCFLSRLPTTGLCLEIIFLSLSLSGSYSTAIIMLGW
jgi:hypothetical protein